MSIDKEKFIDRYGFHCFIKFAHFRSYLNHIKATYNKSYEKIEIKIERGHAEIIGTYSPEQLVAAERAAELQEYEELKERFEGPVNELDDGEFQVVEAIKPSAPISSWAKFINKIKGYLHVG